MPERRDRLARDVVETALEFYRRRLWREVPGDAFFSLRVPDEEFPLAVSVMGQAGEEFGLAMFTGAGALADMAQLTLGYELESAEHERNYLSVSFAAWAEIADEFRRLVLAAGLSPSRERAMPVVFAKPAFELARPARRPELRTVLWALRGVLAAHDAGELHPIPILASGEPPSEVLELEIGGAPKRPSVTARRIPWPKDVLLHDLPPLLALPRDLGDLPRSDQRWCLALVSMPGGIEGDERAVFGVFVAEERRGLVIANTITLGDDLAPVSEMLTGAFREFGLPREVVIADGRLHAALASGLAALDVKSSLDPDSSQARDIAAAIGEMAVEEAEDEVASSPLARWKDADRRVAKSLSEETLDADSARTSARFFGSDQELQAFLEELGDVSPIGAYIEWFAADYRATRRSKTRVERRLTRKRLDPDERVLLEARRDAEVSIYRVDACEPGVAIEVTDVLSGRRYTLHDRALSSGAREGLYLPLRLLHVPHDGGWTFSAIAGPPLAGHDVRDALQALERAGAELSPEGLRSDAHLLGQLWSWARDRRRRPPVLTNTDGDPFEPSTATFRVAEPKALERALAKREDVDHDDVEGDWTWLSAPSDTGERTVLARLELLDDRLVVEVNARRRLERAREWLDAVPGVRFERATSHATDSAAVPLDDRLPGPPPEPPTPDALESLREFARERCLRWPDERVPALGDLTPREACKTADGRRRVALLVNTMSPIGSPYGPIEVPRAELLRELGLAPAE